MVKPVWNNAQRVNHQNFAKKTYPYAKKNMVPRSVLMKSGLVSINTAKQNISKTTVSVNTARQVNTAHSKTTVNAARSMSYLSKTSHSTGNPQMDLQDQGVIDSGCSRHMTGNMSYLTDYEEIDGGYVAFGGNPKGGKITRKASDNACQARKEIEHVKDYILLPLWTVDPLFSQDPKSSHDDGSKPSSDDGKKVDKDPRKDSECKDQEKDPNVNSTNNVNTVSSTIDNTDTNEVNAVMEKQALNFHLI
ncbi:hypothetical protein Tco_1108326 [Tanacetum coccineum]